MRDHAMKAVRFHEYGGIDVPRVEEVTRPGPGPGQVLAEVRAAGIQPGEVHIRTGELHERWPATFPSGQGSDLAGVVVEAGSQVRGVAAGDEVPGFTHNRASHAEFVVADDVALTPRPAGLPLGRGRVVVRGRHDRIRHRVRGGPRTGRHGRHLRCGRRRRVACRAARAAARRHGDRATSARSSAGRTVTIAAIISCPCLTAIPQPGMFVNNTETGFGASTISARRSTRSACPHRRASMNRNARRTADIACRATAELSLSVAGRQSAELPV
jgi:hypothetical protein